MEIKNDIYQKQNTELFIERFRAQGHIYDKAKVYANFVVVISIIVVFGLAVSKFLLPEVEVLKSVSVIYGIISTIVCFILESNRKRQKNLAARIQQLIDCELFDISWWKNWGKKPSLEDIQDAAKDEKPDRYYNWYDSAIQEVSKQVATVICFRSNIMYDHRLRRRYLNHCHWFFWVVVIALLALCIFWNFTILDILFYGAAPALPIIMMYVKTWVAEVSDTKNLEQIRSDLEQMQERMLAGETIPTDENLFIQDAIFTHRKNSFFIPSFFYRRYRNENEESMHAFASHLAEQLKSCK